MSTIKEIRKTFGHAAVDDEIERRLTALEDNAHCCPGEGELISSPRPGESLYVTTPRPEWWEEIKKAAVDVTRAATRRGKGEGLNGTEQIGPDLAKALGVLRKVLLPRHAAE